MITVTSTLTLGDLRAAGGGDNFPSSEEGSSAPIDIGGEAAVTGERSEATGNKVKPNKRWRFVLNYYTIPMTQSNMLQDLPP